MLAKRQKEVVFISHDASLSGAPVLLFNLISLFKKKGDYKITVVIKREGPLLATFQKNFKTILLKPYGYGQSKNIFLRTREIFLNRIQFLRVLIKAISCDLIFNNTIVNGDILNALAVCKKPVVTYIHELENVIDMYWLEGGMYTIQHSKLLIYPSLKVKDILQHKYHVPPILLYKLNYYFPIDVAYINNATLKKSFTATIKKQFCINPSDFIVGGMGTVSFRKGVDLFIEVCEKVTKANNIRFCWIGGFENEQIKKQVHELVADKNLKDKIIFTDVLKHDYYNSSIFDLFFLSSREDPYPLVVLEAGFMKIPTICYRDSGGIVEFINDDAGWMIDDYSIEHTADKILSLAFSPEEVKAKGEVAYKRSLEWHTDEKIIFKQFESILNKVSV